MGQEYFINSEELQEKIRQLLPSQGGAGAGFDLSASTQIIPIVDLTESAEGSNLRQDLQSSLSLTSITSFNVSNTTSTLINTTGYYRVFATADFNNSVGGILYNFSLTDGTTTKQIIQPFLQATNPVAAINITHDFIVLLQAGEQLTCLSSNANCIVSGVTRQLADLSGNLTNP